MMALSAHNNGLKSQSLVVARKTQRQEVTSNWIKGSPNSLASIKKLCEKVDVVTFESEFVSPKALKDLKSAKCKVFPAPAIMESIADRLPQKELLSTNKVPTSKYDAITTSKQLLELKDTRSLPLVIKARRNGYDGYGTYIIKKWSDKKAHEFVDTCPFGVIVEDFIPFKRELAISLAINEKKEVVFLPLVETFQENYKCLWVKGPVKEHPAFASLKKLSTMVKRWDT